MNRIVREHYPVEKLPADLRLGLPEGAYARVLVELEAEAAPVRSLADLDALRRPPYRELQEIVADIRMLRDEEER